MTSTERLQRAIVVNRVGICAILVAFLLGALSIATGWEWPRLGMMMVGFSTTLWMTVEIVVAWTTRE